MIAHKLARTFALLSWVNLIYFIVIHLLSLTSNNLLETCIFFIPALHTLLFRIRHNEFRVTRENRRCYHIHGGRWLSLCANRLSSVQSETVRPFSYVSCPRTPTFAPSLVRALSRTIKLSILYFSVQNDLMSVFSLSPKFIIPFVIRYVKHHYLLRDIL